MDSLIAQAVQRLEASDVVAIPTETVYGLAARIDLPVALKKIFAVKERPFFDPLIVHVASIAQARTLVKSWPRAADLLARKFWPGPLTLVLPKNPSVDPLITSGMDSVGLRCPKHTMALELIREAGPLAAPSANRFGRTSPSKAEHVRAEFPNSDFMILDGGPCEVGIESTVVKLTEAPDGIKIAILRPGAVVRSQLEAALKTEAVPFVFEESVSKSESPGQMKHHYMPEVPLLWAEGKWSDKEALDALKARLDSLPDEVEGVKIRKPSAAVTRVARLNLSKDPRQAARELYDSLRRNAESGAEVLVFEHDPSQTGENWEPVLERLRKASTLVLDTKHTPS